MLPPMSPPRLQLGSAPTLTRRQAFVALLAGAAAVALPTGCTSESPPPPVDNNRVLLESAYQVESALLAVLAASHAQVPRSNLRAQAELVIQEHLDQLSEVLAESLPSDEAPSAGAASDFAVAAKEAADTHLAGVVGASPQTSQVLSSLAASDLVLSNAFQGSQSEPPQ